MARTPKERTQARTSRSDPALVEEYGLDGLYGVDSVNRSGSSSLEIAVHLVGGDVVEADVVTADGLQQREGADQVRLHERVRVVQRVVVVRLRREVDESRRRSRDSSPSTSVGVGDIAHDDVEAVLRQSRQRAQVARVGQRVEDRHRASVCSRR